MGDRNIYRYEDSLAVLRGALHGLLFSLTILGLAIALHFLIGRKEPKPKLAPPAPQPSIVEPEDEKL
jgi:hypothetical protein